MTPTRWCALLLLAATAACNTHPRQAGEPTSASGQSGAESPSAAAPAQAKAPSPSAQPERAAASQDRAAAQPEKSSATDAPLPAGALGTATVAGKVTFLGKSIPARHPVNAFPECKEGKPQEPVQVGEDGGLANAFVYVKDGLPKGSYPVPSEPVVLDQRGCEYLPRVFGIRVGQPLKINNGDPTLHNVHAMPGGARSLLGGDGNAFNVAMPVQNMSVLRKFDKPQVAVTILCDVHPWMRSFAGVVEHPFFAVTDARGQFTIPKLPAGTYTLGVWHERLGEREAKVTVAEGATAKVAVEFPQT